MIRSVFVDVVGNNGIISTFRTASRKYDERRVVILLTGIRHFAREIQGFGVLAPRRTLVTARGFIKTLEYGIYSESCVRQAAHDVIFRSARGSAVTNSFGAHNIQCTASEYAYAFALI